jgi:nicotinamidase-related amidase/type 1 glutamine amidotransferase
MCELSKVKFQIVTHRMIRSGFLLFFFGFMFNYTEAKDSWDFQLRYRVETAPQSNRFHALTKQESWNTAQTAVIVCDMWDSHHCFQSVQRVNEIAPRMNEVIRRLRDDGAIIIHAPSSCMDFYAEHPARIHAMKTPRATQLPPGIDEWCRKLTLEEKLSFPIDDSDGGEDDQPEEHKKWAEELVRSGLNPKAPWKRQTPLIEIDAEDYVSDKGSEIWSVLEHQGIQNVLLMGVHTNFCVLGRPFGLRNLVRNGKNVALVRDMTDTMYNPAMPPKVNHFSGTDLVVEYIEKWICPTITSDQIVGGSPFRFQNDKRPEVVVVMAEPEYKTEVSLTNYAITQLLKDYRVSLVYGRESEGDLPGLESLDSADLLLLSVRRRPLPKGEMTRVRKFVESGKPILGIRTANHAFSLRSGQPPAGREVWGRWDQEVFGGNYTNHHGAGPTVELRPASDLTEAEQAILEGVDVEKWKGYGSLYQVSPLLPSTKVLIVGNIPDKPQEPIAWIYRRTDGGKSFYTSLGHIDDFSQEGFIRLLNNAVAWGVQK